MHTVKVLIVEDEVLIGMDMASHLSEIGYEVLGPVVSYSEAVRVLNQSEIDLVLIDIVLQGEKDGIELAKFIESKINIPYIFHTSNSGQLWVEKSKDVRPSAYLLKPFSVESVRVSIEVALNNFVHAEAAQKILTREDLQEVLAIKDCLFLRTEGHFVRVAFKEINWLMADGNYTEFHTDSERFVQTILLRKVETRLPKTVFMRVHRSYIVNLSTITGYTGNVLLVGDKRIPVSSAHRQEVFKLFDTI